MTLASWQTLPIMKVVKKISTVNKKIKQKETLTEGSFPVIDQGQDFIAGYYNDVSKVINVGPVIVFGDHTKAIKFVDFPFVPGADGTKVLQPDSRLFIPKLFYYFLQCIKFPDKGYARHYQHLEKENINIPPLENQEMIVSKIEELFCEVDVADTLLSKSMNEASLYGRVKKSQLVVDQDLPAVPLSEIVERIQIGPFGSQLHKHDYIENGIPLINPANISNGKIIPNFKKSITREKYLELPMYHLAEGDVILGRRGEMGRSALVTDAENGWFCGTGSIFIRPDSKKIRAAYLAELLSTEYAIAYLENEAGGTTMNNLNKKILSNFPVPLPSIEKQDEILLEIEALKTEISMMNKVISSSINNSTLLKQTILSKAFKGELV